MSDTALILTKLKMLDDEVRELRKEGQRRGEDTMHLIRKLGTDVVAIEKRVSKLEEENTLLRRISQEGDQMQMEALTAAMSIQNKSMDERLTKQDAVLEEQTAILRTLSKTVGHPVLRWVVGAIAGLFAYWLGTKGIKIL